jgi:tetratricopeptide (TPR) repeat protein
MYKESIRLSPLKQPTLFQLAAIYMDSGNYNDAVKIYEQAFNAEPRYMHARVLYGISLMYDNQNTKAEDILKSVPLENLINNDLFVGVFVYRNDYQSLLKIFKNRYNANPDDLNTNIELAKYLLITGNINLAIELLESYVKYNHKQLVAVMPLIEAMKQNKNPF